MAQEPVRIAVFDLNQTVYTKSSKDEFFKFVCYKRNYKLLNIFQIGLFYGLKKLKLLNQTSFKENFFNYLDKLPPEQVKEYARQFWSIEWPEQFNKQLLDRIEELKSEGVQICFSTGGFDVYVAPLFEHYLKVDAWMATQTRYVGKTYKINGKALKEEEKTRRLDEHWGKGAYTIVEAYSDAVEDFFDCTQRPYLMKKGKPVPYKKEKQQARSQKQ
ncbi:HAD family hydrolase [Cesiribacter andamanensis]|uniref:HAD hydrolase, family IB n=1 Tax=Cesiribacter andamanensis AMV16 TaxID=1279009 RepID=M7NAF5_9BACT|nr:HAD family hydrolase [Cesiribacter andamanensis]EMR04181.1 HAD hydrolase, family IB [Cesiribacter andamanensis AMV16]